MYLFPKTMDSSFSDVVLRTGGGRRCRVLYSYSPQNDDELQLQVNDEIDFLSEVEDGWWKGKLGNKIGVFPSNFVCELSNDESCPSEGDTSAPLSSPESAINLDEAPVLPPKPIKETCRVLFAYDAVNDDELTLKKDDLITIITKEVGDKGWWKGELRGKVGLFPDNFVEVITPPEEVLLTQQKKPDRPTKAFDKIDTKIPLISAPGFQKIVQDHVALKEQDDKPAGLKNEGPLNKRNSEKSKPDSPGTKFSSGDKNLNLFQIKADSAMVQRKSAEVKAAPVNKKPVLPPPLTSKPKPISGKPSHVKKSPEGTNDSFEAVNNKPAGNFLKRLSGDVHDLIDGAVGSKIGCLGLSSGGAGSKEDFDLDVVERSDMLTHITSSRPRPPGRRLPTKDAKEIESPSPLTNGNAETGDKEKHQKEREWEKNKPPWMNELKLNLRSSKTTSNDVKFDKKSTGQIKSPTQSPVEFSPSGLITESATAGTNIVVKQFSPQSSGLKVQCVFESGSKVSELSSKFSSADKPKPITSVSPPKHSDPIWNSTDQVNEDTVNVSRKEYVDLKSRMNKLEKIVMELTNQLSDEVEKRKLIEKELSKLTDLVTQDP